MQSTKLDLKRNSRHFSKIPKWAPSPIAFLSSIVVFYTRNLNHYAGLFLCVYVMSSAKIAKITKIAEIHLIDKQTEKSLFKFLTCMFKNGSCRRGFHNPQSRIIKQYFLWSTQQTQKKTARKVYFVDRKNLRRKTVDLFEMIV